VRRLETEIEIHEPREMRRDRECKEWTYGRGLIAPITNPGTAGTPCSRRMELRNEGTRLEMAVREEKRPCLEAASEGENWSKVPWLWRMGA
jgi:hypothetical protein